MCQRMVWLAVCVVLGCSGSRRGASVEQSSGAPPREHCLGDDDCVAGPLLSSDLCCDTGVPGEVVSRAFDEWRRATWAHRCAGVECPPGMSPALPLPCALEPRCVANQCTHSCDAREPAAALPEPPSPRPSDVGEGGSSGDALGARVVVVRREGHGRWLRVEVVASGLVGCEVATADVSCPPDAALRELSRHEWRELDERWSYVRDRPVCRARIDDAAWTPVRVFSSQGTMDVRTPHDPESLSPPECFSIQRLVGWMTRAWGALLSAPTTSRTQERDYPALQASGAGGA